MDSGQVIGLIAGTGRLPEILAEAVKARGHRLVWVTVGEDEVPSSQIADYAFRIPFDALDEVRAILQTHRVRHALLAGRVPRSLLVGDGAAVLRQGLGKLNDRRDQAVLLLIAQLLAQIGVTVISPLEFVRELVVEVGVLTRRAPSEAEWADIRFGMPVARAVAALDVGQTVVVKDGVILAVEAAEGTDATIQRAGLLVDGVRVVKAARPSQDERFDLPTIGTQTIGVLTAARASLLALEAGRTLLLDRAQTIAAANDAGIALVGVEASEEATLAGVRPQS